MATFVPPEPQDFHGSPGEQEVFEALRSLDDKVWVFHSLRWVGKSHRRRTQGEADFVVFDPARGIMVIEVKSGEITFRDRRWFQKNRHTGVEYEMRDPEEQASRSKYEIIDAMHGKLRRGERCLVCTAVWFPSGSFNRRHLPMNLAPEIVFNVDDLGNAERAISKAFDYWEASLGPSRLSQQGIRAVLNLVTPTFSVVPSLGYQFEQRDRELIRLTAEQARIIEFLDEQERAVIFGGAGTGKTVLAVEKARRLVSAGERVLVLCYNRALRQYLEERHGHPAISFDTFHSLARKYIEEPCSEYEELENRFIDYLSDEDSFWDWDHVIIDEGQDFADEWIDWLEIRTSKTFYVFFDRAQCVHTSGPPEFVDRAECRLVLKRNCRNTHQIQRTAYGLVEHSMDATAPRVKGPRPKLHECADPGGMKTVVDGIVKGMLSSGLRPDEIAVLTMRSKHKSALAGTSEIAGLATTDSLADGLLCFSTVRRFKGLEARGIILVDVDPSEVGKGVHKRALYVGTSRARQLLHIVISMPESGDFAAAVQSFRGKRRIPTNRRGFAKLLGAHWVSS